MSGGYLAPSVHIPWLPPSAPDGSPSDWDRTGREPHARQRNWPLRSTLELGALPSAVPCARLHARKVAWEWGLGDIAETLELTVSELVTNGVQASQGLVQAPSVELRLLGDNSEILVEVRDDCSLPPAPAPPAPDSESGRGLLLVDFLALLTYLTPGRASVNRG